MALDTLRLIGSPEGFAVYDNARRKLSVFAIDVFVRPGQPPVMQVALPAGNVDVVGRPMYAVVDPESGKPRVVRRIEWADGASTDFPAPEKPGVVMAGNGAGIPAATNEPPPKVA